MLNEAELEEHCQLILKSRRILGKIVVLCEGERVPSGQRASLQTYARMESWGDAYFYRACIPSDWRDYVPQFFNCGDRTDVLNTYRRLLEIPQSSDTYQLSVDLLFALVDVDLDNALIPIEDYNFSDTEEIFHDLYQELRLKADRLPQHRIWVTGFKHKEAYFLHPSLQEIFNGYHQPIHYKNTQLQLATIYQDMATDLCKDKNLCKKFSTAAQRIAHHPNLDTSSPENLQTSWLENWSQSPSVCHELAEILLAISNSKHYWKQIQSPENGVEARFKNLLLREIATKFYSQLRVPEIDSEACAFGDQHHLSGLFGYLQKFAKS
jgi:hypothetical protein